MKRPLFTLLLMVSPVLAAPNEHAADDLFWSQASALLPAYTTPPAEPSLPTGAGTWGSILTWPHTPVSLAILPNGKLLTYSGKEPEFWPSAGAHKTHWGLWDPNTGQFTNNIHNGHEMFCGHPIMRSDGILQVMGGRHTVVDSSTFDWRSNNWTQVTDMNDRRWYTTAVALPDGDVATFGGQGGPNTAERFDHDANNWNRLSGIDWQPVSGAAGFASQNWPFIMVAPDGRLFHFGPTDTMHWIDPNNAGSRVSAGITVPGNNYPKDGAYCMYDSGKYLIVGGAGDPNNNDASNACYTVDLTQTPPVVQSASPMANARSHHNLVALPSGEVLVVGGNTSGDRFSDVGSIFAAEVWNPATRAWRTLSSSSVPRNYHSTATLLPDGRVFSGGGGFTSTDPNHPSTHTNAQIFTPPALQSGTRPVISTAPEAISLGSVFDVQATAGLRKFSMIRMIATTHGNTSDQRFLDIPFNEVSNGNYRLISNPKKNVMVPGYWMLFGVRANGTYSEAQIIHVKETIDAPNSGLAANYYDGTNFNNLELTRTDALVDFTYSTGSPLPDLVGNTNYSIRWTGWVIPDHTETYTFFTQSDDGVRLWVDNQQLVNNWTTHGSTENSGTISLQAGVPVPITLEYFQGTADAIIQLKWSSNRTPKSIIPSRALRSVNPNNEAAIAGDNRFEFYLDGELVGIGNRWEDALHYNFNSTGSSTIAIRATDTAGQGGLIGHFRVNGETIVTSSDWKVARTPAAGWEQPGFNDSAWANATTFGAVGSGIWGNAPAGFPVDSPAQWIWSNNNSNHNEVYFRLNVGELKLTHDAPPTLFLNDTLNYTIDVKGGTPPYSYSASGLPNGLSLNPSTGVVSGQLQETGDFNVSFTVSDSAGESRQASNTWTVAGSLLFAEGFDSGAGSFSYLDDAFRNTNQPNYASGSDSSNARIGGNELLAFYDFSQGANAATVYDVSGNGSPLNLTISNPAAVNWLNGSLSVNSAALIQSAGAATKLHNALTTSQALTVEAWVNPDNLTQAGPARIATLSDETSNRNFTLGQEATNYEFRLRTSQTTNNGLTPGLATTGNLASTSYQHLVYTISGSTARFYIDNNLVQTTSIPGTWTNWNSAYRFALADELTGGRPWLGDYDLLAIYDRALSSQEISTNYDAGRSGALAPDGFLRLNLGGIDATNVTNMSGAWQRNFNTNEPGQVTVQVRYRLDADLSYEAAEYSEALLSIDNTLLGLSGNTYLTRISGGGDSGWIEATVTTDELTAGQHNLRIGAFNNQKTGLTEATLFEIDEVLVTFTPNLNVAPTLGAIAAQASTLNSSVSLFVNANDANGDALTYSASGLPAGLNINSNTGRITGSPNTAGTSNVTVTVTDPDGANASRSFQWTVNSTLVIPETTSPPAESGTSASMTVAVSGGTNPTFRWNFGDGTSEVTTSNPTVNHNYSSPGRYTVSLTAIDANGQSVSRTFIKLIYPTPTANQPRNSQPVLTFETATMPQAWSVNPDQDTVSVFDLSTNLKLAEIPVGDSPRTLSLAPNNRVWVTNKDDATLSIINPTNFTIIDTINLPRGSQPHGVIHAPNGSTAWVALEARGVLAQLNPTTGAVLDTFTIGSSPRHLAISHDSATLYVARFISPRVAGEHTATPNITNGGGFVLQVPTSNPAAATSIRLHISTDSDFAGGGSGIPNYLGAPAISPAGDSAWVPSKKDNIQRGTLRNGLELDHDNTVRSIASRINLSNNTEDPLSRIDFDNSGLPSAAVYGPYGLHLFVTLEGSRQVAVVDVYGEAELFRFNTDRAPQGLTLSPDGLSLLVHNFMSRTISVHDISSLVEHGTESVARTATLDPTASETLAANILAGKRFFYDSRSNLLSSEDYMSCASCHNDAGHDGRIWDFTGFGEGLRNTTDLRGRGGPEHGALHWSANFDEFQDFEGQIRNFAGGTGLLTNGDPHPPLGTPNTGRSNNLDNLAAYLESLDTQLTSPYRTAAGDMTASAELGRELFVSKNCVDCHSGSAFTDSGTALHDVGTLTSASGSRLGATLTGIDTPSLLGVWKDAPYLHNGSANSIALAISAHDSVSVTTTERSQLVAYLRQLEGNLDELPNVSLAFGGTPTPLPGRLEVENYDTGGQGVSYNDTDPENFGANFGPNFRDGGVDLEASNDIDSTPAIGWIEPGEWSEYTVSLTAGSYDIVARAASELTIPGSIRVLLDGVSLGEIDIQSTAGWYLWQDFTLPNITVPSGQAVLRLEYQGSSFNLNWLEFRDPTVTPPPPTDDQTPFNGVAATIPGTIQAENFDEGGLGAAYLDSEEENFGLTYTDLNYRSSGVDIEASFDTNATPSIGWTDPGEWMEYTVEVTPGTYDLQARVASGFALPGDLAVELDGRNLGVIPVTGTGDWYNWETLTIPNVAITESGTHILRLQFTGAAGFNLNWVKFDDGSVTPPPPSGQSPFGGTAHAVPGRVEAEDYDLGGEGVAYSDADPENFGGSYRGDAVDIESSGDTDNGFSVGWFDNAQWMEYTLATTPGIYQLNLRVASNESVVGDVRVSLDGEVLGTIDVQSTGGWANWVTLTLPNIAITNGGEQVLRLEMVGDAVNVNWFELQQTGAATNLAFVTISETGGQADAMEDSDGDSTSNLAEFAFGSNAGSAGSQPVLPVGFDHEGNCCQTVPVAVGGNIGHNTYQAAGLVYTFQGSTDLENWNEEIVFLSNPPNVPTPPSGYRYLTFRLAETNSDSGYLRVLVTEQSE